MSLFESAVLLLLAAAVVLLIWLLARQGKGSQSNEPDRLLTSVEILKADLLSRQAEQMLSLRDSLDNAHKLLNERLSEGTGSLDRRMAVLGEIEHKLGELGSQAAAIEQVGRNIQSLSDLLRPPKLRGTVGEQMLENLLGQILPRTLFETQYRFPDGGRVDAVVKLADMLLPVDAKFPLEAFVRLQQTPEDGQLQKEFSKSFRQHVDAIADKYIKPQERTTTFALMYIPAEAVYHQLVSQTDQAGFSYALSRRVIPSSPGHLYAFLASVSSLQAELNMTDKTLAENTRRLLGQIGELIDSGDRLIGLHRRMEGSLRSLSATFDKARHEAEHLRGQAESLRQPFGTPPAEVDRPPDVDAQ